MIEYEDRQKSGTTMENIRNFAIIAHIDAGKSTLADRFLELTGTIGRDKMRAQYLDQLFLERERGITIKMAPVRMRYHPQIQSSKFKVQNDNAKSQNKKLVETDILHFDLYALNLIDTPGHVDFSYEVSRALAAVEGAILLIDGTKGVQAQTLSHANVAKRLGLTLIPAINKIDAPTLDLAKLIEQIQKIVPVDPKEIHLVSARTGEGVSELIADVVRKVPPPSANLQPTPRALIFDSHYDPYKGVILHVRAFGGSFRQAQKATLIAGQKEFEILELGYFNPELVPAGSLEAGEIGYIATGLKDPSSVRVGDTVIESTNSKAQNPKLLALPGYQEPKPVVFASFFPQDGAEFPKLKVALDQFRLFDPALHVEKDYSAIFGQGFELGFLGLLHMEIVRERIEREFGRDIFITIPTIAYRVNASTCDVPNLRAAISGHRKSDEVFKLIKNPNEIPTGKESAIEEPWLSLDVLVPTEMRSAVLDLVRAHRGEYESDSAFGSAVIVRAGLPLRELIAGFYDELKNRTSGYGSLDYALAGYRPADLSRLEIHIAEKREDALTQLVPRADAYQAGKRMVERLKELLPKENFAIKLQAVEDGRIIARETIPALKKNVTGHLYGGDRTRKEKLWKKQKKGKQKLQSIGAGKVAIKPSVVIELFRKQGRG